MLPTGTVTFLFTDIEGSTPLYQKYPDAMRDALARHHAILENAIAAHNGNVFQIIGDAFCAAFASAPDALSAALDAQRVLKAEAWGETGPLNVRMGLHTGEAETRGDDYASSLTLIRAQRLMSAGHGGQTLLSLATEQLTREHLPVGASLRDLGVHRLRGLAQPERIFQLSAPELPTDFPPLRVPEPSEVESETAVLLEQLVRGKLVGRAREEEQLRDRWVQALQGHSHLALISGEPGVGKTRLAGALISLALKEGATVLKGGSYEYEASTPYLPFVEALRDWVHSRDAGTLRAELGATAPEIVKLAPELESKLGAITPNPLLPPNEERLRLFDNLARLLQTLAGEHGLLLFLDDLHWADQGTLSLLHYILRHLRNDKLLVLAAYRELELDRTHPLAAALVEWNRERLATRLALGRLSFDDTSALLATLFGQTNVSPDFAEAMYRETEGNPFFIEEVVKALIEQGQIYRAEGEWQRKEVGELAIPQSVKEAIGRRLNRLSAPTVDILHTAAALGKVFPFGELAAVLGDPAASSSPWKEDQLLDALDEASAAQLLRADSGDSFAFTHDKIREVLYEELNPIRRRRLHQRIGDALEKLNASTTQLASGAGGGSTSPSTRREVVRVQDLAYHFAQSGDLDKALAYSIRAAENAERLFAHDEALDAYRQARESAEALERPEEMTRIDEAMGDIFYLRGMGNAAIASFERALEQVEEPRRRGVLKLKIGEVFTDVGDPRGAEFLHAALDELDPVLQTNQVALTLAMIGRYHHYHSEHYKAIEYLDRARSLAEPNDDAPTLAAIFSYLAGVYQHLTQFEESNNWARKNLALGERKQFPLASAYGFEFLSENASNRGLWNEGIKWAKLNADIGARIGAQARVAWAGFSQLWCLHGKGELKTALQVGADTLVLCEAIGEGRLASIVDTRMALISGALGDLIVAREYAERSRAYGKESGQVLLEAGGLIAISQVEILQGNWEAAFKTCEEYEDLIRHSESLASRNTYRANSAEGFLRAGKIEHAAQIAAEAYAVSHAANAPHYAALAQRVQAEIFALQGDRDKAFQAFKEAIASFEQSGSRLELARALVARAQLHRDVGEEDEARQDAERAIKLFEEVGARVELGRAEKFLAEIPAAS